MTDFEVTKFDWLVTIIDPMNQQEHYFENDQPALVDFYDEHKSDIWIGCNNHHYDDYILKGLLCDFDPYDINEHIITKKQDGWKYSNLFRKIPLRSYDVMTRIDRGLKVWEGFLGNMIKESETDFRIQRKLTKQELAEMRMYNRHDVEQTIEVFLEKKNDFDAIMSLIKMFPEVLSINDIGLTKAQISAKILECEKIKRTDEFDLFVLPCIQIKKYRQSIDFFLNPANHNYEKDFKMMVAGIEHTLGWGGIHAGKEKYRNLGKKQGRQIWHIDVASFYPRLMIFHNLLTRNSKKPEKFKMIYDRRIELKRAGKKMEQAPLKIVINGTYGISKAKSSTAYDPRNANLICINGQLMLIDLIEHLESIEGFELIQSNTDGLIISLPDTDEAFDQMDDICHEWEVRCNMELEFDEIGDSEGHGIYQKDVNNYVFVFATGKVERKGTYVKELGALDYDLPIVNKAVVEALVHGTPVERTIGQCDDLKEFQMIKKIGQQYSCILHGGFWEKYKAVNPKTGKLKTFVRWSGNPERLNEKCVRIFASKDVNDGGLWKVKGEDKKEKLEGTPDHCFIYNDEVNGVKCPSKLDKQWYIKTAKDRLKGFGVHG
jgi:DNA polymerase